jgi:Ribbon-helix-helix protein, copG family.
MGNSDDKFVLTHIDKEKKEDKTVTMTLRIDRDLQEQYDELSQKSGRSRNQIMNMALRYALERLTFEE